MQWFYDRGCELIKVDAEPGDLILWDSAFVSFLTSSHSDSQAHSLFRFLVRFIKTVHHLAKGIG